MLNSSLVNKSINDDVAELDCENEVGIMFLLSVLERNPAAALACIS